MDRPIKNKVPEKVPDSIIYTLKGILILLFSWNFYQQIPEDLLTTKSKSLQQQSLFASPFVEEISYHQSLNNSKPRIEHFIQWGKTKIPYIDPDLKDQNLGYHLIDLATIKEVWNEPVRLYYKSHLLQTREMSLLILKKDGSLINCSGETGNMPCSEINWATINQEAVIWLSVSSKEKNTFFTRIKFSDTEELPLHPEAVTLWKKLVNKEKHRHMDNLSVSKPVFKHNKYLFKWGDWERYTHGPHGGRRVKVSIEELESWSMHQPDLFKDGQFVPFNLSIHFWTRSKRGNRCQIDRLEENAPKIKSNECYKDLIKMAEVGDLLSLFIFFKGDYLSKLSRHTLNSIPSFMVNDQYVQLSIPLEIVKEAIDRKKEPLRIKTATFPFQLNSSMGQNSIVKLDVEHPKNEALLKHYETSNSARVIPIDNYKTIRRVLTKNDLYIKEEEIEKIFILTEKVFKTETFPEFYDFDIEPPMIKARGLSTVLDNYIYDLVDFQKSTEELTVFLGEEPAKILQFNLTVIPKNGKAVQFITDKLNRFDINKRLNQLGPETSLYFDQILLEKINGEQLLFPLATALHLK